VGNLGAPPDAMWVVDMRGAASVAFAASLSNASPAPIAPIATFNNWPAENELVPAEEALAAMIDFTPRIPGENTTQATPVVMLDGPRALLLDDPVFFARAHGGFGGLHAVGGGFWGGGYIHYGGGWHGGGGYFGGFGGGGGG